MRFRPLSLHLLTNAPIPQHLSHFDTQSWQNELQTNQDRQFKMMSQGYSGLDDECIWLPIKHISIKG